jgi:methylmalonyl-CoA mutase N-terminal domain/subunit
VELHPYDPRTATEQIATLAEVRRGRDDAAVETGLGKLRSAAQAGENLMPVFVECVRTYATVGEMVSVLKDVYGEFEDPRI